MQARDLVPNDDETLARDRPGVRSAQQFDRALEMYPLAIAAAPIRLGQLTPGAGIALKA